VFGNNGSSSSDEDSRDSLMFSRLPGLSSDVISDVFHQLPATTSVSVSADSVAYYLSYQSFGHTHCVICVHRKIELDVRIMYET